MPKTIATERQRAICLLALTARRLPYALEGHEPRLAMLVVLPPKGTGLSRVQEQLISNPKQFVNALESRTEECMCWCHASSSAGSVVSRAT